MKNVSVNKILIAKYSLIVGVPSIVGLATISIGVVGLVNKHSNQFENNEKVVEVETEIYGNSHFFISKKIVSILKVFVYNTYQGESNMKLEFDEALQIMRKMHMLIDEVISIHGNGLNQFEFKMLFMIEKNNLNTFMAIKEDAIKNHKSFSKDDIAKFEVKIAKMSKKLIELGLIELERTDNDARCKKVIVTPLGKELIKKIDDHARKIWKELNNESI